MPIDKQIKDILDKELDRSYGIHNYNLTGSIAKEVCALVLGSLKERIRSALCYIGHDRSFLDCMTCRSKCPYERKAQDICQAISDCK